MSNAVKLSENALNTNILHEAPTALQEPWRFTPLAKISDLFSKSDVNCANLNLSWQVPTEFAEMVALSSETLEPLTAAVDQANQIVRDNCSQSALLKVKAGVESVKPLVIARKFGQGRNYSRLRIEVGANSHFQIAFDNQGKADLVEEIELVLGEKSHVRFLSLQDWSDGARHLARIHAEVAKDAELISDVVSIGGSLVRILPTVNFAGPHASATLNGLYFATDGNHSEHRVHVNHLVPDAKSRVLYKGALSGANSHTVWFGDVFIGKSAINTDTYELNRNLVLTEGARADSVPNLEIETGEIVGAGHASTTGKFDEDQLFYLMSRGIDKSAAKKLVVRGYFAEITDQLKNEELQERITARIEAELERVDQ